MRRWAVGLALDDFGVGHSALAYLRDLPVREMQIDRSFLQSARSREEDRVLLEAIVRLAATLGLAVVAEGVESREDVELLRAMPHPLLAQGFYYCRPLPAREIEAWLRTPAASAQAA